MTENERPPTLPQYPAPLPAIQKPGMLGKMVGKMLKPTKIKTRMPRAKLKKKQAHFY